MGYMSCNRQSAIAVCDPRRKHKRTISALPDFKIRNFLFTELLSATNSFSADNFLGKGSHGAVYKAKLVSGQLAAVKKTTTTVDFQHCNHNHRNCSCTDPAQNEIEILSRIRSPRLVNLIGFSSDLKGNKLIVVEYFPNGSLYDLLHSSSRLPGWKTRVRFALQAAKAVAALHGANPPVIHRDIKSSNILIDENWNAKLGDFGLALRGHVEEVRVKCAPPAGTIGYLDPGYLVPSDVSTKSDVFSYGILLLEIISGRHAIDLNCSPPCVVDWAVPLIKGGEFKAVCDGRIGFPDNLEVIRTLAVIAARCVRSTLEKRPEMSEVVECLKVVRKRFHAPPVWSNMRRRVKCNEYTTKTVARNPALDAEVALTSWRCRRKISSVASV